MASIVEKCREVVKEREGEFLTMLVGNPAVYMIPTSAMTSVIVDSFAASEPQAFVEAVGQYLFENVEVA